MAVSISFKLSSSGSSGFSFPLVLLYEIRTFGESIITDRCSGYVLSGKKPLMDPLAGAALEVERSERNLSLLSLTPFLPQWPAGRLLTAPQWPHMSQRSTVRCAMGVGMVPRASDSVKALAASARTQASTWASSSKSELPPYLTQPQRT